ncbi:MAG: diguanylate cyclase [Deltaproteobacteria bacterium]|nr:diguanylate cyclase [Deltaproteobacteria bacterium]
MNRRPGPEATPRAPGTQARERSDRNRTSSGVTGRVLLIDADSEAASRAADLLAADGHDIELAVERKPGVERGFDVVVVDPGVSEPAGVVQELRPPGALGVPEVIVTSAIHDVDAAVAALHRGASDWLVKPVADARLRLAIGRALERRRLLSENERLRRDLALFAAAQRVLETLDREQLAGTGADALCSVSGAAAASLWADDVNASRGLSAGEAADLRAQASPLGFVEQRTGAELSLPRFGTVLLLDLGDGVTAAVLFDTPPSRSDEEGLLFLARQLATAFKNGQRYKDAADQALRDPLTGLWNAASFSQATSRLVDAGASPFSLLFLDIDHFKHVNDQFGHLVGSRVLVEIARTVEDTLREGDVVSRYGGDELTALLPGVDVDVATKVAERVRAAVAAARFAVAPNLRVSVTVGVASFPLHGLDVRGMLDAADRAMYRGKESSRNIVIVAEPVSLSRTS